MYFNVLFFMIVLSIRGVPGKEDERALQIINTLITRHGYPLEIHEIETQDGYFLTAHRIPHGKNHSGTPNQRPVLFVHGLGGSAENFVWLGPGKSSGFELADAGYDVWLLNVRGSWHSMKHRTMDPDKDGAFWDFSWHEIAIYDTPAAIDYILNLSNQKKLHYIGHSQGTSTLFAMGSELQEYNDKIKVMIAMGPASVNIKPKHPLIRLFLPVYNIIVFFANILRVRKIPPYMSVSTFHNIFHGICGRRYSPVFICKNLVFLVAGVEHEQFDTKMLPLITQITPGGISFKQTVHYVQTIKKGKFQKFDYGKKGNFEKYGSKEAPLYNITRCTFPVALFYCENDYFVSEEAIDNLVTHLPNIVEMYKVPHKEWTHIDFIWGRDVSTLVNVKIKEVMMKYDYT